MLGSILAIFKITWANLLPSPLIYLNPYATFLFPSILVLKRRIMCRKSADFSKTKLLKYYKNYHYYSIKIYKNILIFNIKYLFSK